MYGAERSSTLGITGRFLDVILDSRVLLVIGLSYRSVLVVVEAGSLPPVSDTVTIVVPGCAHVLNGSPKHLDCLAYMRESDVRKC